MRDTIPRKQQTLHTAWAKPPMPGPLMANGRKNKENSARACICGKKVVSLQPILGKRA